MKSAHRFPNSLTAWVLLLPWPLRFDGVCRCRSYLFAIPVPESSQPWVGVFSPRFVGTVNGGAAHAFCQLLWYVRSLASTAQQMRASLLAKATVATFVPLRACKPMAQRVSGSVLLVP